jgi:uncharacterized integral membrane protein
MQQPQRGWPSRHLLELVIGAISVVLLIVFIALNSASIEVDFLVASANLSIAWALLISGGLGFLTGFLVTRIRRGG